MTLPMYTLIPTVHRALLKSAVSGTDHRIHTTKETQAERKGARGEKACWGFVNPEIVAGTAELLAPHSGQLTSSFSIQRITGLLIASFPAMQKKTNVSRPDEKTGSVGRHSLVSAFAGARCPAERQ